MNQPDPHLEEDSTMEAWTLEQAHEARLSGTSMYGVRYIRRSHR
jgi:hypothetical protein